ncbi:MAG: S9 family peptidase, partial [Myxococcales bacterium]|nr:S9 family peptidase [Myxococcales bacterium]
RWPAAASLAAATIAAASLACGGSHEASPRGAPAGDHRASAPTDEEPMHEQTAAADETKEKAGLSTEDVAQYPLPGMLQPTSIAFSPDDRFITYLRSPDASLSTQLYAFDPETGEEHLLVQPPGGGETEENLSHEEKLRRERQRVRGLGITRYAWTHHKAANRRVLVPMTGGLQMIDAPTPGGAATLRELVAPTDKPALDPRLSRDGEQVAFVMDDELYVVPAAGGTPRQLTRGARGSGRSHGLAEYIAQEEMGRSHGYWWSHDGKALAFTEIDETHIPIYRIVHQGKDAVGEGAEEDHRYPFAGQENARVRLAVVDVKGGNPRWLDLGEGAEYLARVHWMPDGRLLAEVEDRAQSQLRLLAFDPRSGKRSELLRESSDVWINLHGAFKAIEEGEGAGGFLWASERSGFRHLYLYDGQGTMIRQLTEGSWAVDGVAGVDEARGLVYFTAGREDPTEHHLYAVPLAGGEIRRITEAAGTHGVVLDHGLRRFVDVFSSPEQPPTITLRDLESGAAIRELPVPEDPRLKTLTLVTPEIVGVDSRDGVRLYGAIYRPPERFGHGPFPTLVSVYGGPHAQRVTRSWGLTADMRAQFLASQGYVVFKLDNRGSARRGLAFEGAIRHDMGNIEVQDQVDGVRWLANQGLADSHRVGIYGWSYGGYMAAIALARAPETFKVAIAGAPVTHWDGYDTHYTERYMGTPQLNPEGYARSSVM